MSKKKAIINVFDGFISNVVPSIKEAGYKVTYVDDFNDATDLLGSRFFDLIVYEANPPDDIQKVGLLRDICNGAILTIINSDNFLACEPYLPYTDDILLREHDPQELVIRAKALAKYPRAPWNNREKDGLPLVFGDLSIFAIGKSVTYRRAIIHFTRTEFNILYYLACNAGIVVSRYEIYTAVWHEANVYDIDVDKNINNHMSNIRKKLKHHTKHDYIRAENGEGYAFIPVIEE